MEAKSEQSIKRLAQLIDGIKIAMVTTVDKEGVLHSRPLATQESPFDGQLYFFVKADGGISELDKDQRVNVSYADPNKQVYVSVSGDGVIVRDTEKMQELWHSSYKAWFPDGLEDPKLALLWVNVEKAEYWDSTSSYVLQALGFARSLLTGKAYEATEHRELSLQ